MDKVGEKVGGSNVDKFGVAVINANLPGGHWITRHNSIEQELASLCIYAGLPAECEPYGLFGHLLPQQALHQLQRERKHQVLRSDLRLEIPPTTVKVYQHVVPTRAPPTAAGVPTRAPPTAAPVSTHYSGSMIAEIKVIGKGVKSHYKLGTRAARAVDSRASKLQQEYELKAAAMDAAMGEQGEGVCLRRLREFPSVLDLCFGSHAEGSTGVHVLVSILAACRVRTLALRGKAPSDHQLGLETAVIRRRLSTAAVRANQTCLLSKMGQVGEGSSLAGSRRSAQRSEEKRMELQREADWLCYTGGRELVRRGRFWGR
jgi:hypothetical protein